MMRSKKSAPTKKPESEQILALLINSNFLFGHFSSVFLLARNIFQDIKKNDK